MKKPNIISATQEYQGAVFKVVERKLQYTTGEKLTRQIVLKANSVIVAIVYNNKVYVQNEYRSGINKVTSGFS